MKKITHSLRAIMALVLCLVGTSAMAIDNVTLNGTTMSVTGTVTVAVDVPAETAYTPGDVEIAFDLDQVLSILGISDIAEASQYLVNVTTGECVENTTDSWRDWQGDAAGWGTEGGVCVKIDYPEYGIIDYVGTYDEAWEEGDEYVALWAFIVGDKVAIVEVDITFTEPAESVEGSIYAVGDITVVNASNIPECSNERYIGQGFATSECTINIEGAAAALGLSEDELAELIYGDGKFGTNIYVGFNDDLGIAVDSLEWLEETDGWLQRSSEDWDGMAGDLTNECRANYYGTAEYFIQYTDYDPETHEMSFVIGQLDDALQNEVAAETLNVGDAIYTNIYILNAAAGATSAYVIKHNFVLIDMPSGGAPSEMKKVGEESFSVTLYHTSGYESEYIYPDTETAASLLGCSESEISLLALAGADKFSVNSTANNGGWWFDETGYVGNWGSAPNYVEPYETGDYSVLVVGTWGAVSDIGEYEIPLYMVYGSNYYLLTITVNIIAKPEVDLGACENVLTTTLSITQELDDTYTWSEGAGIALTQLQNLIGTTDPDLYGKDADGNYSDDYSCDPTPGFWMTADGYTSTWGSAPWGMSIAYEVSSEELIFNCIQMPGLTEDGDVYTGTFYLANLQEEKLITVILVYTIGDVVSYTSAGNMDVVLPLPTESGEEADYPFKDELEEICEDLEIDMDYFADLVTIRGTVGYTTANSVSAGVYYDMNGYAVEPPGSFFFCFDGNSLLIGANEDLNIDNPISTQAVLQCESTQLSYTLNITFVKEDEYDDYVAVKSVLADDVQGGAIYDLSGRQVAKAVKGVYIQNGKKMLVK